MWAATKEQTRSVVINPNLSKLQLEFLWTHLVAAQWHGLFRLGDTAQRWSADQWWGWGGAGNRTGENSVQNCEWQPLSLITQPNCTTHGCSTLYHLWFCKDWLVHRTKELKICWSGDTGPYHLVIRVRGWNLDLVFRHCWQGWQI